MATDTNIATLEEAGWLGTVLGSPGALNEANKQRQRFITAVPLLAVEASAATATDVGFFRAERALVLIAARIYPLTALTADASNYATVTITYDDDAGGSDTTLATIVTSTVSWTANRSVAFSVATDASVPSGSLVHFITAKTGTGVVVPISRLSLLFQEV